LVLLMQPQFLF